MRGGSDRANLTPVQSLATILSCVGRTASRAVELLANESPGIALLFSSSSRALKRSVDGDVDVVMDGEDSSVSVEGSGSPMGGNSRCRAQAGLHIRTGSGMRRRMVGVKMSSWKESPLSLLKQFRDTVLETWGQRNRRSIE